MALVNTIYNIILKKSSTYYLTAFVSVFAFERMIDVGCDAIFDRINEGKLWKDIKHKYVQE